jgi:hypothetical protein
VIGRLLDFAYGAVPAEFESAFGLEESVRRLAAATERSIPYAHPHEAAVGRVSEKRVWIRRANPRVGNSFKPFYIGRFRQAGRRVVLSGRFTPALFPKLFMTFWLGLCLAWTVTVMVYGREWWAPLPGLGLFAFGVVMVVLGKRSNRSDIPWLSEVIRNALSGSPRL